ncbi:MAG: TetR/AcrR family transcriptional regulator [Hydrogenobacter thermophilus]|uniref:TetR/AcrR family transcriptional regulator n=1 Tax=Hydrogenobacter thermophilus TaxID=940 RepID=UPI001C7633F7|nr:TetR/AcrR family transcriptional regulator [Hydrogenobacter thermophilus]QWK19441.1 MAG: TetR/AcrR family transcriptional regulator [Hydrogenobacter thermophilus]
MDTKERLLNSAKKLFSKKGYYETRVSDIVADAGLSQGAFYLYFKSKEDIFKSLVKNMSDKVLKLLKEYASKEDNVEEIIKNSTLDFFRVMYEEKPIAYIFLFQLVGTNEEFRNLYFEKTKKVRELLNLIVEKGVRSGIFSYRNTENIVNILMGYVKIVYLEYLLRTDAPLEEILSLVSEGIDVILKGVKA